MATTFSGTGAIQSNVQCPMSNVKHCGSQAGTLKAMVDLITGTVLLGPRASRPPKREARTGTARRHSSNVGGPMESKFRIHFATMAARQLCALRASAGETP